MERIEVKQIFNEEKQALIAKCSISPVPTAVLLGGQPASGKSALTDRVLQVHLPDSFLVVNGDMFRNYHPEYDELKKNELTFSRNTQIFSDVFTEELIGEACRQKFNIIIEGTMRNPDVPFNTARLLKQSGFRVEVYAIAAPSLFTRLGIFNRYQKEVEREGYGRLADVEAHDAATVGTLKSIDRLYETAAVDKITLFTHLARKKVQEYCWNGASWNITRLPSEVIVECRKAQLYDKSLLTDTIEIGSNLAGRIADNLRPQVLKIVQELNRIVQEMEY
jgi:adenylate kinase family enzyme